MKLKYGIIINYCQQTLSDNIYEMINNIKYIKNGEDHIKHINYYMSGEKKLQSYYNNKGELDGEYKKWYVNNQIAISCFYINDRLYGEYKDWYRDGTLCTYCFYKDGKVHGEYIMYNPSGTIYEHLMYDKGKIIKDI